MDYQVMAINFLQGFGVLSIAVVLTEFAWRNMREGIKQDFCTGAIFSLGILGTMLLPFQLQQGFIFDLRHVFLVIAGAFGGWPAIVLTYLTSSIFRIVEGGAGQTAGLIGISIASALSLVYVFILKSNKLDLRMLISMGVSSTLFLGGLLALPTEVATMIAKLVGPSLVTINFLGILIAGHQLSTIKNNISRQRDLETKSATDPLTGLLNRRAFESKARDAAQKLIESQKSYSFFVLDIDNFKTVNDTFGHACGDKVIQGVAKAINANKPDRSILGRFGGEEYVLFVPNIGEEQAMTIAQDLRKLIESQSYTMKGMDFNVTASFGFVTVSDDDVSWEDAFELADNALFQAKREGRNCAVSSAKQIEARYYKAIYDAEAREDFALQSLDEPLANLKQAC